MLETSTIAGRVLLSLQFTERWKTDRQTDRHTNRRRKKTVHKLQAAVRKAVCYAATHSRLVFHSRNSGIDALISGIPGARE